jgi:hypothetical protein
MTSSKERTGQRSAELVREAIEDNASKIHEPHSPQWYEEVVYHLVRMLGNCFDYNEHGTPTSEPKEPGAPRQRRTPPRPLRLYNPHPITSQGLNP